MRVAVLASPTFSALGRLDEAKGIDVLTVSNADALGDALRVADVLLLAPRYGAVLRDALPHARALRWIHALGAGVETLPFDMLRAMTVAVTNSRGIYADALSEFVIGAMLWFAKDFARLAANKAARRWEPFHVERLEGKTLGIIGYGAIGHAIGRRAEALGMHVLATRRSGGTPIDELIPASDFVTLSTPLTEDTRGLMNAKRIAAMRTGAVLINISRGAIVDERALVDALEAKRIRGAALDVFETEPLPHDHRLWQLENVLISPHSADRTTDSHDRAMTLFLANLDRFRRGEPLQNVVDLSAGY